MTRLHRQAVPGPSHSTHPHFLAPPYWAVVGFFGTCVNLEDILRCAAYRVPSSGCGFLSPTCTMVLL